MSGRQNEGHLSRNKNPPEKSLRFLHMSKSCQGFVLGPPFNGFGLISFQYGSDKPDLRLPVEVRFASYYHQVSLILLVGYGYHAVSFGLCTTAFEQARH